VSVMVDPERWREKCVVAYLDEPPYFMPVPGTDPTGCDIEVTQMVLHRLGVGDVEFVLTKFGELIDGVLTRRWHLNTPMFVTKKRSCLVRFSAPVWAAIDSFIVRADDDRDFTSYESIAADDTVRLAAVTGQIQVDTALAVGMPRERVIEFDDQDTAARAVLNGLVDASVSTAPGNAAHVARLADPRLISVADARADERGGVALGAFSFHHDSNGLADAFDARLLAVLGTPAHLAMMARYGLEETAIRPALDAIHG